MPRPTPSRHDSPPPQQLRVAGLTVEVWRKSIKNVHLRIRPPDGRVTVSAPHWLRSRVIHELVAGRLDWIERKRDQIRRQAAIRPSFDPILIDGQSFELLGRQLTLRRVEADDQGLTDGMRGRRLGIQGSELWFTGDGWRDHTQARKTLQAFYRRHLQDALDERLEHWCAVTDVRPAFVGIKRMKTRWGSCNTRDARIWLNLELARLPLGCIDHVLVHELTHLHERLHNARFHALMDRFMPAWRQWSDELDRRGMVGL